MADFEVVRIDDDQVQVVCARDDRYTFRFFDQPSGPRMLSSAGIIETDRPLDRDHSSRYAHAVQVAMVAARQAGMATPDRYGR